MPSIRVLACLAAACLAAPAGGTERLVWFGTHTGGKGGAEGIYVARFDDATGGLSAPVLAAAARNPSFLALHPSLPALYAVAEVADAEGTPAGAVQAFAIDPATGRLTAKNYRSSGGPGPCHVSVDRGGRVALAANYGGGSTICLGIGPDGGLEPVVEGTPGGFLQHVHEPPRDGASDPGRRPQPHGHSIDPAADGRFAIACDLGLDTVFVHALDTARGTLAPHAATRVRAGAGPRHFALHPNGRFGYCVNELDLTVTAFRFDPRAGTLADIQTLPTLPAEVTDRRGFSTAEIAVHPTGTLLYASNRGHDSIATYAVDATTGRLEFRGVEPARVKTPRHFAIAPGGRFLLTAGQDSGTVAVFAVDPRTGRLSPVGETVAVPACVCICFWDRGE